jgi:hypothetical protein
LHDEENIVNQKTNRINRKENKLVCYLWTYGKKRNIKRL